MKKESFLRYLGRFILSNLASLAAYLTAFIILNTVTGGAVSIMSGAEESRGWNASDLSPFLQTFIPITIMVLFAAMFFMFYIFLALFVKKSKRLRDEFIRSIGTTPYDRKEYEKTVIKTEFGKTNIVYFGIIVGVGAILCAFGIPFVTILMTSQNLVGYIFVLLIGINGVAGNIVEAIIMLTANMAAYILYIKYVVPRIFEKWASERLRIDK